MFSNYAGIVSFRCCVRKQNEDIAKSKGLKSVMLSSEFCLVLCKKLLVILFCLALCKTLLRILYPADAILQTPKSSLKDGIEVIKTVHLKSFALSS